MADSEIANFTLTPHRSMSDEAFAKFLIGGLVLAVGLDLLMIGVAGWVAGAFLLANVLFLGIAFVVCRNERFAIETVAIGPVSLSVIRCAPNGKERERHAVPLRQLTVRRHGDDEFGCRSIILVWAGRTLEIGAALAPDERASFFEAFVDSLRTTGNAPRIERSALPNHHGQRQRA